MWTSLISQGKFEPWWHQTFQKGLLFPWGMSFPGHQDMQRPQESVVDSPPVTQGYTYPITYLSGLPPSKTPQETINLTLTFSGYLTTYARDACAVHACVSAHICLPDVHTPTTWRDSPVSEQLVCSCVVHQAIYSFPGSDSRNRQGCTGRGDSNLLPFLLGCHQSILAQPPTLWEGNPCTGNEVCKQSQKQD